MSTLKEKKVGLALGGGAVLGAVHVGVLKALEEKNVQIHAICGTSAGAIVAALYAFGKTPQEIENIIVEFEWKKLSSLSISKYGLLSNEKIGEIIKHNIGESRFKDADIPLGIIATDITTGEKVILDKGSVSDAVVASTCIPGIFIPVEIKGRFLVDGGIVENVPLSCLKGKDVDFLIGVDLIPEHSHKKPQNIIEVLYNSFNFLVRVNKKANAKDANLIIKPDLSEYNAVDMSQIKELIDLGYEETKKIIKEL